MSELKVEKINLGTSLSSENPNAAIHITRDDNTSTIVIEENMDSSAGGDIRFWKTRNGAATEINDYLGSILFFSDRGSSQDASVIVRTDAGGQGSAKMQFRTKETGDPSPPIVRMTIKEDGKVGIGTSSPATPLSIKQVTNNHIGGITLIDYADNTDIWAISRSNTFLRFGRCTTTSSPDDGDFTTIAYIDPADADAGTDLLDFTGQHRSECTSELKSNDNIGLIVSSTGIYKNLDQQVSPKINQALPSVELSKITNDKKVYGVISSIEDENEENRLFKTGALVSSYKKNDNRLIINALGEGAIWITNINGNLENGDYITSSEIHGYGMKQDDDILHNYSVAKITQDCSFDISGESSYLCEELEHDGQTYKRAFVGCTYHCG